MHLVTCFAPDGQCRIYNGCVLHSVLHEALEAFFAVLDRYCLADLVRSRAILADLLWPSDAPALKSDTLFI